MSMNKIISILCSSMLAAAGIAGSLVVQPSDANARSVASIVGQARHGSQADCFYELAGGPVQQYCNGGISWVFPIVYDNAGFKTIRVTARGANSGANNVSCRAYSVPEAANFTTVGSEDHTVFNNGAIEQLTPGVHAHGFGGTWVTCSMERYTRLYSIHYWA